MVRPGSSLARHALTVAHFRGGNLMRKTLLMAATLGTLAVLPEAASAGGYRAPQATSALSLRIVVQPAPRTIVPHHPRSWQLRPQPVLRFGPPRSVGHAWHPPVARAFWHSAPRSGWHQPWRRPARQIEGWPDGRTPRHHGFERSWHRPPHQVERWAHGREPWRHGAERHAGGGAWRQMPEHRARHGRGRH